MTQVVDYSFARPSPAAIRAAGYVGVMRYLAPLPNSKVLTAGERDALLRSGLSIGVVWETVAARAGQGAGAGAADAVAANRMATDLGFPADAAIYYAVDYDAVPSTVVPYFQGVNSFAGRPVGVYGGYRVVEGILNAGLARYAWQAYAWSGGMRSSRAHLFQRYGGVVVAGTDVDDCLQPDWGQWPRPTSQENDLTDEEHVQLNNIRADVDQLIAEFRDFVTSAYANFEMLRSLIPDSQTGKLRDPALVDAIVAKLPKTSTTPAGDVPATVHFPS